LVAWLFGYLVFSWFGIVGCRVLRVFMFMSVLTHRYKIKHTQNAATNNTKPGKYQITKQPSNQATRKSNNRTTELPNN
jgi:uncharacterized membrane protein